MELADVVNYHAKVIQKERKKHDRDEPRPIGYYMVSEDDLVMLPQAATQTVESEKS